MILHKETKKKKSVNPIVGLLLFIISVILLIITAPLGLIFGVLYGLSKGSITKIGEYLLEVAITIDQSGNVIMQHLLNVLWIKSNGVKFGNPDETISSVLGKNEELGTLTSSGKGIAWFLNFIDKNHTLNSIDYYIQPNKEEDS